MSKAAKTSISYDLFFGMRKWLVLTFYTISAFIISITVLLLLFNITDIPGNIEIGIALLLMIISTILGIFLSVLLDIPNFGKRFDEVKNNIAKRVIQTPKQFADSVSAALCDYFSYPFFDLEYALMAIHEPHLKFEEAEYGFSDPTQTHFVEAIKSHLQNYLIESSRAEEVLSKGKIEVDGSQYYLYLIPIWFDERHYGYMAVFSENKLAAIFRAFLSDIENLYIDDQLLHVLEIKKQIVQRDFYRAMDTLSNKITKREYAELQAYQEDVLKFLISETRSQGGIFGTVYSAECVSYFEEPNVDVGKILPYLHLHKEAKIFYDPNTGYEATYIIPILIDREQGVIYLFAHDRKYFEYFNNTLREIENIKLDNDLENLAYQLNLSPITDSFLAQLNS